LTVIIFLLGLGILAAAIAKSRITGPVEEYFSMAAMGVAVMIAAFLLQLIWPRRLYVLVLRTSSGDVDAVVSRNKDFVSNVQKAVEQAFVVRARRPPVSETWRTGEAGDKASLELVHRPSDRIGDRVYPSKSSC
jgi:hypothetical protein